MSWDEAILTALDNASVVLLILSANANRSPFVKREIERAASREMPIVPFRIEEVAPGRSLEFFIKVHHWLDGFPGPINRISIAWLPLFVTTSRGFPRARAQSRM